jgi:hypothetical protein
MAEPPSPDDRPLGLAPLLDDGGDWARLLSRVHRSIERRELSGQAVELSMTALASVLVEYLKALATLLPGTGGRIRAE